ncbi:MAG: hypothetical protein Q9216_004502 [Gyalolechia sp. 2 TL-2023]
MSIRSVSLAQRKVAEIQRLWCFRGSLLDGSKRTSSSQAATKPVETATNYGSDLLASATKKKRDDLISKELLLDVLGSTATKREAKSYLSRFRSEKPKTDQAGAQNAYNPDVGVNLGNLYVPVRAIDQSPLFIQGPGKAQTAGELVESLHIALVKIREPQSINETVLQSVALTLVQLNRLGMSSVVVVDCERENQNYDADLRKLATEQADRVAAAIEHHDPHGARRLDNVLQISEFSAELHSSVKVSSNIYIASRSLVVSPLRNGKIPVVAPIAFASASQALMHVPADEAMLALTRNFAGIQTQISPDTEPQAFAEDIASMQKAISLDRVILLDPLGGIPSLDNQHRSHVFINLEQEYDAIESELSCKVHLRNLGLLHDTLAMLPPSSSGLLTMPETAANSKRQKEDARPAPEVGTRRQRNPLIHNLLTDKPVFSSSLPSERSTLVPATFVKRGMPVSIIPDPKSEPWKPPSASNPSIQLSDPRIDLPRLIHLIEDSFNRKLDVSRYLSRVENRIAGIIVAGEYEGGAILTWEPSLHKPVPYLDKFAVLKRSQGAGGVADIVFKAMVRSCFPDGVCWRSRKDNPVNKWYFERARGSWKLPQSNWTMFWTTAAEGKEWLSDYESVCRRVEPSWADTKGVVD